ncbi:TPA: restriction endonuclease subunit S, partial [Acinetobacter baumannii]|nr:restriction endonuclease subunit S [Acinetobacter baumannii]
MAVPKLRFKDFDEDWTLTTLNQLSTKIGDGIHATPKYDESGTIPFINGNNLVNGRIAINENTKRISSEEFQKYNQILSDRTLFLSINGTIGNLAFYKNEKVLLGKSVCFINLKNDLDKKFIYLLLQSPQLTKTLNSELTGTTIKNLSLATVRNSEFYCPIEAEQTKIASFLSAVDEKISQLTQKHQLLSQYKQGMMQKLFSQQIRFKADDGSEFGEWEEVALSKVSDVRDGTHDSPSYVKDGYPLITSKNLKNGKLDLTDINLISEDDYLNINKRSAVNIG